MGLPGTSFVVLAGDGGTISCGGGCGCGCDCSALFSGNELTLDGDLFGGSNGSFKFPVDTFLRPNPLIEGGLSNLLPS